MRFVLGWMPGLAGAILANSAEDPIIVSTGDQGPRGTDESGITVTDDRLEARSSTFGAYHLPGADTEGLFYEGISTANVMRTILNECFGTAFPLLSDTTVRTFPRQ